MILVDILIARNVLTEELGEKAFFSEIPDTRNTRRFWKDFGYGLGIGKNFGFGSGIGYPLGTARVRRVGFFNFGLGRVRVLKKYFGSGRVGYWVFVSNTKSIGYYGVLKSWSGIRRVSPLFPILSNIYYLIWLIWSIKRVFGRHIYLIVVQCGRSWQPFGDRRKSHKPLESAHLQNFATKMPYL